MRVAKLWHVFVGLDDNVIHVIFSARHLLHCNISNMISTLPDLRVNQDSG